MSLLKEAFSRERPATSALIAINAAVFVGLTIAGGSQDLAVLIRFGALVHHLVWEGQYWRLVTPMFIHIGLLHFLLNSYALLILGRIVEPMLGWRRFLAIYLGSGVCGCIGSLLFTRGICAGASGAIFGLLGALLALEYLIRGSFRGMLRQGVRGSVIPVIAINLILGALVPLIDNNAHIAGLLAGFAIGYYFAAHYHAHMGHSARSTVVLALFMAAATAGVAKGIRPPGQEWEHHLRTGTLILASGGRAELAVPYLERATRLRPQSSVAWYHLARAYAMLKPPKFERAAQAAGQARTRAPKHDKAQLEYAVFQAFCLEQLYRVDEALEVYIQLLPAFPKAKQLRSRTITCLLDQARYADALAVAKAGLAAYPRDVWCYHGIETAARAMGHKDEVRRAHEFIKQYYERQYRSKPSAYNANNLAWTYAEGNVKLDEAWKLAQKAVEDQPDEPHWLDTLGWVQFKRGDLAGAIKTLKRVAESDPQANYAHYHLAEVLAAAKRDREALAAVRRALTIPKLFEERWAATALANEVARRLGVPANRGPESLSSGMEVKI